MSDDEADTPPESLFFMRRAEFVPKVSAEEYKSVSAALSKNDDSNYILVGNKKVNSSSAPVKRSKTKNGISKKASVDAEENIEVDLLDNEVTLSASAKRRLKKKQQEQASELRLVEEKNRQVLAAADEIPSLNEVEEIVEDKFESNTSIILTISYMSDTTRLRCYENEKFSSIFPKVADTFKLKASEMLLCLGEQNIKMDDTPKSLNITLSDSIECIPYKADGNIEVNSDDQIKLVFQSSDSKEKIDLFVHKLQKLEEIMEKYSKLRDIPLDQLVFEFDGECIEGSETPEDLDMESGNCVDVKIKAPAPSKKSPRSSRGRGRGRGRKRGGGGARRSPRKKETVIEIDDDSNSSDVLICD